MIERQAVPWTRHIFEVSVWGWHALHTLGAIFVLIPGHDIAYIVSPSNKLKLGKATNPATVLHLDVDGSFARSTDSRSSLTNPRILSAGAFRGQALLLIAECNEVRGAKQVAKYLVILRCAVSCLHTSFFHVLQGVPVSTVGTMPGPGMTIVGIVPSGVKMILSLGFNAAAFACTICNPK